HAIVSYMIPECERVQEITTIPRGMAGGYTKYLPDEKSQFVTSARLRARIASSLGGHCAEQLVFGDVTSGSTSDIKSATSIARSMVTEYGMSELGPIFLSGEREIFLGKSFQQTSSGISEELTKRIDAEISRLLTDGEKRATAILTEKKDKLEGIVEILLEKERMNREEFEAFMEDRPYDPARAEAFRMGRNPDEAKEKPAPVSADTVEFEVVAENTPADTEEGKENE
ncbi:MAG: cell division protein FtsH, partial [Clostridia bacterium]|nr:cell division protein FtsH [Clostridia bacterium]